MCLESPSRSFSEKKLMAGDRHSSQEVQLSRLQKLIWPVARHEQKKFLPMVWMMFFILFNYTIVRNIKDSMLIYAPHSDEHVLPYLKILFVTPITIAYIVMYSVFSNRFSKQKLFYITLAPFAVFFALFPFVLYPMREALHFSPDTLQQWQQAYKSLAPVLPAFWYWLFSIFYVMSELWGNVAVALLFWQFANQITPTSEAKRFYPIYGFWSNLGLVAAGLLLSYAKEILVFFGFAEQVVGSVKDFGPQVKLLCSLVVVGCVCVGLAYWWMNRYVLTDPRYYDEAAMAGGKKKKSKPTMSIGESVKFLIKSKYLGYITVLVLSYGIVINLVEISWKGATRQHFIGHEAAYSAFMGKSFLYTGLTTMALIVFSQNILRKMGWLFAAMITPWMSLVTGGLFFFFLLFKGTAFVGSICEMFGYTPLGVAVWMGLCQSCLTKGAKYSLFDPTKEMAYIPLDEESKIKGKAAIDVIGGRAGKSGGSIINVAAKQLFSSGGNAFLCVVGSLMVTICLWWLWAVGKLSAEYHKKMSEE